MPHQAVPEFALGIGIGIGISSAKTWSHLRTDAVMTTHVLNFFHFAAGFFGNPPPQKKTVEKESLLVDSEEFNPVVILCWNQHVPIFQITVFGSALIWVFNHLTHIF